MSVKASKTALGRLAGAARRLAKRAGQLTYQGQPCDQGHNGVRYTASKHCVLCRAERSEWGEASQRNTVFATYYPAEFDALGWHRVSMEVEV